MSYHVHQLPANSQVAGASPARLEGASGSAGASGSSGSPWLSMKGDKPFTCLAVVSWLVSQQLLHGLDHFWRALQRLPWLGGYLHNMRCIVCWAAEILKRNTLRGWVADKSNTLSLSVGEVSCEYTPPRNKGWNKHAQKDQHLLSNAESLLLGSSSSLI